MLRAGPTGPAGAGGRAPAATARPARTAPPAADRAAGPVTASGTQLEGTGDIGTSGKVVAVLGGATETDSSGAYGQPLTIPPGTYYMVAVAAHAVFGSVAARRHVLRDRAGRGGRRLLQGRQAGRHRDRGVGQRRPSPSSGPPTTPPSPRVIRVRLFCTAGSGTTSTTQGSLSAIAFDNAFE